MKTSTDNKYVTWYIHITAKYWLQHRSKYICWLVFYLKSEETNVFALITDANMCDTLAAPAGGTRSSEDLKFAVAGTLTFTCNLGFTLVGSATVTCQNDGTFDAAAPTCGKSYT